MQTQQLDDAIHALHDNLSITTFFASHSRVAQWKRAGPITQRSEDQNLALLGKFFLFPKIFHFTFRATFPCR